MGRHRPPRLAAATALTFLSLPFVILAILVILKAHQ